VVLPKVPHSKSYNHSKPGRERASANEAAEAGTVNLGAAALNQAITEVKQPLAVGDEGGI